MHVESVPNRNSRPTILIRHSYREDGKVKKRTFANITHLPPHIIDGIRLLLRDGIALECPEGLQMFEVLRSRPHGHVAAVLGTVKRLGLPNIIYSRTRRERDLVVAMIVARLIDPGSKLATARQLDEQTLCNSLGELLGLQSADEDELYAAMDWLLQRQERIEKKLAKRHLSDGALVLYDVSSTYFEGRKCPLAKLGHSRDGKRGKLQITFGLVCNADGCPVAVEVFEGNTSDPKTLAARVHKLRQRFHIQRVVWVGDRGMITEARIREELRAPQRLDWITALRAPQVRAHVFVCMLAYYVQWHMRNALAPMLFDDHEPEAGHALRHSIVAPAQRPYLREGHTAYATTATGTGSAGCEAVM